MTPVDNELINDICFAQRFLAAGERIPKNVLLCTIPELDSPGAIDKLLSDENGLFWKWVPAIMHRKLGSRYYSDYRPAVKKGYSLLLVNPKFTSYVDRLGAELSKSCFETVVVEAEFKSSFTSKLYGGFPWYKSYYQLCAELGLFGRSCFVIYVRNNDTSYTVTELLKFKDTHRMNNKENIEKIYPDLPYPGKLRPFHTPNNIENSMHVRALESETGRVL